MYGRFWVITEVLIQPYLLLSRQPHFIHQRLHALLRRRHLIPQPLPLLADLPHFLR